MPGGYADFFGMASRYVIQDDKMSAQSYMDADVGVRTFVRQKARFVVSIGGISDLLVIFEINFVILIFIYIFAKT